MSPVEIETLFQMLFLFIYSPIAFLFFLCSYLTWIDSMPLSFTLSWVSGNMKAWPSASPLGESLGHTWSNGSPLRGSLATTSAETTTTFGLLTLDVTPPLPLLLVLLLLLLLLLVPRHSRLSSLSGFCETR